LNTDELVIPVPRIEERSSRGSLMPDGLDRFLTDAELADLIRFLSEVGKPGPFAVSHVPVARRWQVLAAIPDALKGVDSAALGKALRDSTLTWNATFATIAGDLPLADIATRPNAAHVMVRCELDVATAGTFTLRLNDASGVRCWIDGHAVDAGPLLRFDAKLGIRQIDFAIDLPQRKTSSLRLELVESPGARGAFVGGR